MLDMMTGIIFEISEVEIDGGYAASAGIGRGVGVEDALWN